MLFNSFSFIVVFPLLFLGYYLIPSKWHRIRNLYLLTVSYALYISWKPAFAIVLLGVSLITFWGGRILDNQNYTNKRKLLIWVLTVVSLLPLLVFKYYNFLSKSIVSGLSAIGLHCITLPGLNWAVPIGLSFYTFQAVGYLLDVYYGRIRAEENVMDYLLFVSFFPSIISGPINKASLVLPQIKNIRQYFDYKKAVDGLKMILWGMFMKVVVADRVGLYVDTVLPHYMNYTGLTCFAASVLFSVQIYSDFAGYSLMAIGVGKTLGFELTENFRRPYFSVSITEFWHRWHISLSTWLKDYVYIPLGGSHCPRLRNYWNIFVTFLVSGIWHGANWTFIMWGAIHGICQIMEKLFGLNKWSSKSHFVRILRIFTSFLIVNFAWIFFRMPTINDACSVIERIFDFSIPFTLYVSALPHPPLIVMGVLMLFIKDFVDEFFPNKIKVFNNRHITVRWAGYLGLLVVIVMTGVFGSDQFIYASF